MKGLNLLLVVFLAVGCFATTSKKAIVAIKTNKGEIQVELDMVKAPISSKNFLKYVKQKKYDGTIFHRVINNFMIQGGGFKADMSPVKGDKPIKNEATNGLKNQVGTIAMARTQVVESATNQFFINVKDNAFLDHKGTAPGTYGYAVFGKVIKGMEVVNSIKTAKTLAKGNHKNVPVEPIIIESVRKL